METEGVPDEAVVDSNDERGDRYTPATRKIVGLIVALVLVIVARAISEDARPNLCAAGSGCGKWWRWWGQGRWPI
jgi:hypothetical protein